MMPEIVHGCLAALAAGAVVWAAGGSSASAAEGAAPRELRVYIGGRGPSKGGAIYVCRLDLASGALSKPEVAVEVASPTFQVIAPGGRRLYSVNETGQFAGVKGGGVSAFAIDPATGALTLLNQQPTGGAAPCHISLDRQGKWLLGANYSGGNVFVFPIGSDGRLGERTAFVQHTGRGTDPRRQTAPHAHSINLDPAGRFALAADLGLDKVLVYRFDPDKGTLTANEPPSMSVPDRSGPRHLAFHPDGRWVYVINEMGSTMTACAYDADKGVLTAMQTISTLPEGFAGNSSCAEVQVHPSGRFVYGSNRGHDSIALFAVEGRTGKLTSLGQEPTRGKHPRNFRIDPTGAYLLAANRDTNNVVVFRVDGKTGALKATGQAADVPGPNCVKMIETTSR